MKRTLYQILAAAMILALAAACAGAEPAGDSAEAIETIVTVVTAPDQAGPERPPCFPDPAADYIPLPESENLAQGKRVISGAHTDVYVDRNVNDGKTDTYWESKGFPAEITIVLGETHPVSTVAVCLNPAAIWEPRKQEIAVQLSLDGETFTEAAPAAVYSFDAATGNRVRIDFATADAAFVRLVFTMNSSSRTGGAQAAEICVYE